MRWLFLLAAVAAPVLAELPAPNPVGVSFGHIQLKVHDGDAELKAWTDIFAPKTGKAGPILLLEVPGIYIIIGNGETKGGSAGSALDHVAFAVKDYAGMKSKLKKEKLPVKEIHHQLMATFPEGVRVEFLEDKGLSAPIAFHHVHLAVPDPEAERDWYVKHFGAVASSRGDMPVLSLPGGEIEFEKTATPQAPSRGRTLDHFGLEVKDLEPYCDTLTKDGVKLDLGFTVLERYRLKAAFVTDPGGAYIELTEGLADK